MSAPTHRTARTTCEQRPAPVRIGHDAVAGAYAVPVIAPVDTGADVAHAVPAAGMNVDAGDTTWAAAGGTGLIVDVTGVAAAPDNVAKVMSSAAAIVIDHRLGTGAAFVAAARRSGTPVVLRTDSRSDVEVAIAAYDGAIDAVLVNVDQAFGLEDLRQRVGVPVVVRVEPGMESSGSGSIASVGVLAGIAVAAGADALWLSGAVSAADVGQAREAACRLGPLVRPAQPQTLAECREVIDGVDAVIATLLEHRVGVAGHVQRLKPVGGYAGRDGAREAAIVRGMSKRAPSLPAGAIQRIMGEVIDAGLDVAERGHEPPVWRG